MEKITILSGRTLTARSAQQVNKLLGEMRSKDVSTDKLDDHLDAGMGVLWGTGAGVGKEIAQRVSSLSVLFAVFELNNSFVRKMHT